MLYQLLVGLLTLAAVARAQDNLRGIFVDKTKFCPDEPAFEGGCPARLKGVECSYYPAVVPVVDDNGVCTGWTCSDTLFCTCDATTREWGPCASLSIQACENEDELGEMPTC